MSKTTENEEENQLLLQKIMNLIPKDEQAELMQKVDNLTSKNNLSNNSISKSRKVKNKVDKYDVSNENFCLNPENMITTIESFESNNPSKSSNNTLNQQKNELKLDSEHISLFEETEEEKDKEKEKENNISYDSHKNIKKERKVKNINKFCGKKRKNIDEIIENENEIEIKNDNKIRRDSGLEIKNKNEENSQSESIEAPKESYEKKEHLRKLLPEKERLINLVKKEGFMKIFNNLTTMPLDRKDPLEKEIDDIITNIGLLRTSLILFQIKFAENELNKNTNTNTTNNSINNNITPTINKNKTNSPIIHTKKKNEDIQIVIDGVDDECSSKENQKNNNSILQLNKSQVINNKINKKISSPKSKSVKKETNKEELELGVHLQKDKSGNIYKYTKHHYRANRGNDIYVYYCADTRCKTKGCYFVKSMKFECIKKHELEHDEHCYIKNKDRFDKYRPIIEEFEKRDCHEAQIFKKDNGSQLVKWYD